MSVLGSCSTSEGGVEEECPFCTRLPCFQDVWALCWAYTGHHTLAGACRTQGALVGWHHDRPWLLNLTLPKKNQCSLEKWLTLGWRQRKSKNSLALCSCGTEEMLTECQQCVRTHHWDNKNIKILRMSCNPVNPH